MKKSVVIIIFILMFTLAGCREKGIKVDLDQVLLDKYNLTVEDEYFEVSISTDYLLSIQFPGLTNEMYQKLVEMAIGLDPNPDVIMLKHVDTSLGDRVIIYAPLIRKGFNLDDAVYVLDDPYDMNLHEMIEELSSSDLNIDFSSVFEHQAFVLAQYNFYHPFHSEDVNTFEFFFLVHAEEIEYIILYANEM